MGTPLTASPSDPLLALTQDFTPAQESNPKNTQISSGANDSDGGFELNLEIQKNDIQDLFKAKTKPLDSLIRSISLASENSESANEEILYLKNLFEGRFTEVNDTAFSHLSVLAKESGVTYDQLHDFFKKKPFYNEIKDLLRVDQPNPTLLEPTVVQSKLKKNSLKTLLASLLLTLGVGGGTQAIVNSGNPGPSGMSHEVVVEPIRQLHQPSSTKTLSLNDKSNTFEELQQYFAQNPDENSNWSAVYNLINVSGIADEFSNRKIEIVDFETYNGSHRFELGGQTYTLNNYNEQIVQQNVFPPCVHLRSSQGTCLFNQRVINNINKSQYDLRDLQTITLPELLNTPKYGRGALADEARRNALFFEFEKNTFTTQNYRSIRNQQLSSNPTGPSELPQRVVNAEVPIKTISSSKTEGN